MKHLTMTKYLELELQRFHEMGYAMPSELVKILKQRAKNLDKQCAAEQQRATYANMTDEEVGEC